MPKKLQNKIFLFFSGLVIALTTAISIFIIVHLRSAIIENVESQLFVTQRVFDTFLGLSMEQAITQTRSFSESGRFKAAVDTRDSETILQLLTTQQEIIKSDLMLVTDYEGNVLANTLPEGPEYVIPSPLLQVNSLSEPYYTDLWSIAGTIYQIASAPIYITDHIFGYVKIGHAMDDEKALEIKNMTQTEITFITNDRISASTFQPEFHEELSTAIFANEEIFTGTMTFSTELDEHVYLSFILPIKNITDDIVGYSLIQKSLTQAYGFLDEVTRILIFITALALIFSLVISFFIARSVTAPVNSLVMGANELAKGNYDVQVEVQSKDEMGFLAKAFNNMGTSLRISFRQLEKLNKELVTAMKDLKNAQEELIKSERLSTIGSMMSSIIHDFKNPMTVIKGYTQLLMQSGTVEEKRQKYGKFIIDGVERITNMTQELLDFARGETKLQKGDYKIKEVIDEIVSFYALEFPQENIKFTVTHGFDNEIPIDRDKIKRVLDNLIGNAIQAIGDEGLISIATHVQNGDLRIDITDDGKGIPEEIKDKLFEPFVTFGKSKGTGLGLAVSKKIVEEHNGKIWVESKTDEGTTFHITLPLGEK